MGQKFWGGLSKCILIVSKKWWRFCSKRSLHNRTWRKNIFAFPQKYFSGRAVKTAINLSREKTFFSKKYYFSSLFRFLKNRNFLKEFDSAKKTSSFIVSGHRAKQNRRFGQKISAGLSRSSRSKKALWLNTILEKVNFCYNFGILKEKTSAFWRRVSNSVLKGAFYVSRETF